MAPKIYKSKKRENRNPANGGSKWLTRERRFAIYERDGFRCVYCGCPMEESSHPFTLDHIIPCELGGTHASGNLVSACKSCNSMKRDKSQRQFFAYLRGKGVDTVKIAARIRRLVQKALKGNFRI